MKFKTNSRLIIEIVLVLVVAVQSLAIMELYKFQKVQLDKDLPLITKWVEDGFCKEPHQLVEQLMTNKAFESTLKLGEHLQEEGFQSGPILNAVAEAHYIVGNKDKAIIFLKQSLKTGDVCNQFIPSELSLETSYYDKAIVLDQISEIYNELGIKDEAMNYYESALLVLEDNMGEKYTVEMAMNMFNRYSIKNILKKDNKEG